MPSDSGSGRNRPQLLECLPVLTDESPLEVVYWRRYADDSGWYGNASVGAVQQNDIASLTVNSLDVDLHDTVLDPHIPELGSVNSLLDVVRDLRICGVVRKLAAQLCQFVKYPIATHLHSAVCELQGPGVVLALDDQNLTDRAVAYVLDEQAVDACSPDLTLDARPPRFLEVVGAGSNMLSFGRFQIAEGFAAALA